MLVSECEGSRGDTRSSRGSRVRYAVVPMTSRMSVLPSVSKPNEERGAKSSGSSFTTPTKKVCTRCGWAMALDSTASCADLVRASITCVTENLTAAGTPLQLERYTEPPAPAPRNVKPCSWRTTSSSFTHCSGTAGTEARVVEAAPMRCCIASSTLPLVLGPDRFRRACWADCCGCGGGGDSSIHMLSPQLLQRCAGPARAPQRQRHAWQAC
mmetsp:Transcript_15423/g.38412  ORF Transcript_15423/g.38412 Transcript_15423/m.38412 type:complete len:212 (+) Transcript_15423:2480-3115(+)